MCSVNDDDDDDDVDNGESHCTAAVLLAFWFWHQSHHTTASDYPFTTPQKWMLLFAKSDGDFCIFGNLDFGSNSKEMKFKEILFCVSQELGFSPLPSYKVAFNW